MQLKTELLDLLSGDAGSLLDALLAHVPIGLTMPQAPEVLRVSDTGSASLAKPRTQLEEIRFEQHSDAYQVYDPDTGLIAAPERLPLTRATVTGETVINEEWLLRPEDGREITILCNAGPIRNSVGDVVGGLIAGADISDRKDWRGSSRRC